MAYWILQSTYDPRSALHRISELLNQSADDLCVELGLSPYRERVSQGWVPDSSQLLFQKMEEMSERDELEAEMSSLLQGKSLLRFLGEERVVAKQKKIKARLQSMLTRHDLIRWFYHHPRIWLLACVRDAALDASRSSETEWVSVDDNDETLAPTAPLLLRGDSDLVKKYSKVLEGKWNSLSPDFILNQIDGHRSLRFDLTTQVVSFCESVALPETTT